MLDWFRNTFELNNYAPKKQSFEPTARQVKSYFAAQNNRLFEGWTTQPVSSDEVVKRNLRTLRARSREQALNNDYMARFLGLLDSNVVGPKGFALNAQPKDENGTIDQLAANAIEAAFKDWSKKQNSDLAKGLNFKSQQKLFIKTVAQDGEFIAIEHYGARLNKYGYSLQLVDPETLDVELNNDELSGGRFIRMGIEFNAQHAPIAYHFLVSSGEDYSIQSKKYKRVLANRVIHAFVPTQINQKRGMPWAGTALARMKMLEGYENAAITAARAGASKMGFFTTPTGEEYMGDDEGLDGATITDFEAGTMEQLPEGVSFQGFDPSYPSGEFAHFMKACLRGISSGLGINYNALANDLEGVNFSSIRAGVLEDREVWKGLQNFVIDEFLTRVFENWLTAALMKQAITVKGRPLKLEREEKYQNAYFQGKRWDWVDPVKDISALEKEVGLKITSLSAIMREKGRDPMQVWEEIAAENKQMEELGITREQALEKITPQEQQTEE